jgi:hypothetical protein
MTHGPATDVGNNQNVSRRAEMDTAEMTVQPDLPAFFEGQRLSHVPLNQLVACIQKLHERVAVLEAELRRMRTPQPVPVPPCHEVEVHRDGTVGAPLE